MGWEQQRPRREAPRGRRRRRRPRCCSHPIPSPARPPRGVWGAGAPQGGQPPRVSYDLMLVAGCVRSAPICSVQSIRTFRIGYVVPSSLAAFAEIVNLAEALSAHSLSRTAPPCSQQCGLDPRLGKMPTVLAGHSKTVTMVVGKWFPGIHWQAATTEHHAGI